VSSRGAHVGNTTWFTSAGVLTRPRTCAFLLVSNGRDLFEGWLLRPAALQDSIAKFIPSLALAQFLPRVEHPHHLHCPSVNTLKATPAIWFFRSSCVPCLDLKCY